MRSRTSVSFNPVAQGERHDPDGTYVRRWIPELAGVPDRFVHAPWTMPQGVQAAAGCMTGRDYPGPIDGGPARPARQTHHAVKRCPKPFLPDWL